jgi:small subunit ribosomal protein S20
MATKKSAKKALRKSKKRTLRNLMYKKRIKNLLKMMQNLIKEKKIQQAKELLPKIYKALDKAAKVGVIKENTASRKKSKITKLFSKLSRQ